MFGSGEIIVILVVILILFGGKRLPEFARSLGLGIREFKKACNGEDELVAREQIQKGPRTTNSPPVDSSEDRS